MEKQNLGANIDSMAELVGAKMNELVEAEGLFKALNDEVKVDLEVENEKEALELKEALAFLQGDIVIDGNKVKLVVDFANVVKGIEKFKANLGGE